MKPVNLADAILKFARQQKTGWVFTPKHLLHLGTRAAVDQALHRLVQQDKIRRLARGIYDLPACHPVLGLLAPNPDAIAKAVAEGAGHQLQITPASAANLLGLSTQVPAKLVYLTDGGSRKFKIGGQTLELKHASPRALLGAGRPSGVVFQAVLGVRNREDRGQVLRQLGARLDPVVKKDLLRLARKASQAVQPLLAAVAS